MCVSLSLQRVSLYINLYISYISPVSRSYIYMLLYSAIIYLLIHIMLTILFGTDAPLFLSSVMIPF